MPYAVVAQGPAATARRCADLRADGIAIVDAIADADLAAIGEACADLLLVTGGSGAALGLPRNFERQGLLPSGIEAARLPRVTGHRAVISGSCSVAANAQVAAMRERHPSFRVDANALARGDDVVKEAAQWAASRIAAGPVLIYATAPPGDVRQVQAELGAQAALVESALAGIASELLRLGVTQLIVAGGETSGVACDDDGHLPPSRRTRAARTDCHAWPLAVRARSGAGQQRQHQRAASRRLAADAPCAAARQSRAHRLRGVAGGRRLCGEELEETAKLFPLLRGTAVRPLDAAQIAELRSVFGLDR